MPDIETNRPKLRRRTAYRPALGGTRFAMAILRRVLTTGVKRHASPNQTRGRALDVGCGAQPLRGAIEAEGMEYFGMDVVNNEAGSVHFLAPIDGELPSALLQTAPFEFLVCTEVLEHVADWDKAFSNMTSLMAPGARLLITSPFVWQLHEEPYDFWRPTIYALRYFAGRAGLQIVEEERAGNYYDVLGSVIGHATLPNANWLTGKLFRAARLCAVMFLAQRWLRWLLPIRSGFYLSNCIVLRKEGPQRAHEDN